MRTRALLLLGYAAVIVILIASGAVIVMSARSKMQETIDRDAQALAAALMDQIELAIRERVHVLRASVVTDEALLLEIEQSNATFAALGPPEVVEREIAKRDDAWRAAANGPPTPTMQSVHDSAASAILRRTMSFHSQAEGQQVFAEIFVTNRDGANVGQTGRTEDYAQKGEDWWDAAWERGAWISNEVARDDSAGVDSVDIGLRIDADDGRPIGVLKAVMTIDMVREIIEGFGARSPLQGAVVEVIAADGSLVHRLGAPAAFGEDLAEESAVRALLDGRSGALVETTARGEQLRAYVQSRAHADGVTPRWSLILNQATDVAYGPVNDMTNRMLITGIVGASLALLIGLLMSGAFGRMTQHLQATTDALRGSEAHVRSIVTNAVDGIITADHHGRIETMNPAAERMFGHRAEDVIGRNLAMLMPEPYASAHDDYVRRYRDTGEGRVMGRRVEVRGLRADGTEFPLALALGETKEGGMHCYVGVLRDVTERREAQRALEEAKDAAESASRSKSQFLANMSHELRTPLNAIIGYSEMIAEELEESPHSETASDVGKIRSAGLSLLGLIDQILDLSKVEAGRLEAYAERFDLNETLDDIVATVTPLMRKRENVIELVAPPDLGAVFSDATKVRQILLNLLSNAAKFTQCGAVRLSAERETGHTHDWMVFTVRDDGIGMTPEELERVWDAFAQADASTTRRYGGTGLGLTITRKFTELLGGSVDVTSRPGAGTTFCVRLPAPDPPPDEPADEPDPSDPIATPVGGAVIDPTADAPVIAVIDDDDATRDLVRRYLSAEGFHVVEAATGEEGLRLVHELHPTAIVLDVLMPGMDGWSVLSALRESPDVASTPVVMLTVSEERDLGFALGVDAFLSKPVNRDSLALALAPYRSESHHRTILVVEDDDATREILGRVVRRGGFEVVEAANGAEALERLAASGADVAIVDLMMPVMDGFDLVQALRADARWRELPVIVVTARDLSDSDVERLQGAVQEIVRKASYSQVDLLAEVGRLVRRALQRRSAPDA